VPPSAVAIALPDSDFAAVRDELASSGFEPICVDTADDLERVLAERDDIRAAILDCEGDLDRTLEMYAMLHEGGRHIPALMLMPAQTLGRMVLGGRNEIADEYFSRPFTPDSVRWRIEALLIRVENLPADLALDAETGGPPGIVDAGEDFEEEFEIEPGGWAEPPATTAAADAPGSAAPAELQAAVQAAPAVEAAPEAESGQPAAEPLRESAEPAAETVVPALEPEAVIVGTRPVHGVDGAPLGRAIIVFNPKGGVGKTTVSINLGAMLQLRKHRRVLLIDCDTVTGHIATSLGLGRIRTLSEAWLANDKTGQSESIEQIAAHHSSGVDVLVLSSTPFHTEVLVPLRVAEAVAAARASYDFVILDLHPDFGPLNLALFDLADRMIVPVTPDVPCILAAVQFREVATALEMRERLLMVINRANSGVAASRVERSVAVPTLARLRSAGMLFNLASGEGKSAVERTPNAKVVGDIEKLTDALLVAVGDVDASKVHRGFVQGFLARLTAG
jgi:MinD-like ATPase involved in chromosome partitioning or flagellar assembly